MPDNLRSVIYAFDRSFEGAVAACGMPLVGESCPVMLCHLGSLSIASMSLAIVFLEGTEVACCMVLIAESCPPISP